jgi:hypothetical protein
MAKKISDQISGAFGNGRGWGQFLEPPKKSRKLFVSQEDIEQGIKQGGAYGKRRR